MIPRLATACAFALTGVAFGVRAEPPPSCAARIDRANVVACALCVSALIEAQVHALEAAQARELAVRPLLPSNPTLSLSAARRSRDPAGRAFNWSASLSQELEIADQRGARLASAHAGSEAERARVLQARRLVTAEALFAYFDALSAREQQLLAASSSDAAASVALAARARAAAGLVAPVDADVADAAALRQLQAKLAAARHRSIADSRLASLLGQSASAASLEITGELEPLASSAQALSEPGEHSLAQRPELRALAASQRELEQRAIAYRRARVTNPTLSLFVQDEGFSEHVLGLGVSLPIPLPGIGRTYAGEIAEAEASARRALSEHRLVERELRLARQIAQTEYRSRAAELEAFAPEQLARARASLLALAREVESGRLAVRDAIVAQAALFELLQAHVAARAALCNASVELVQAAGLPVSRWVP